MNKIPPFVTHEKNSEAYWFDRLAAFLPLIAAAFLISGLRSLILLTVAALTAAAVEGLFCYILQKRQFGVMPIAMGLSVAMVCPVSAPLGMVAAGSALAAALSELLAHFRRNGLISPPAVAWLVLLSIAPGVMCTYPVVGRLGELPLFATSTRFAVQEGILAQLEKGILPNLSTQELLLGKVPGSVGAMAVVAVLISFLFLAIRRSTAWEVTVGLFGTMLGMSVLLNKMAVSDGQYALLQLSAGGLWYAAVFMASDTGAPKTRLMRVVYGVVCGLSVIEMRAVGFGEFAVPFAIVSCGVLCNLAERLGYRLLCSLRNRRAL